MRNFKDITVVFSSFSRKKRLKIVVRCRFCRRTSCPPSSHHANACSHARHCTVQLCTPDLGFMIIGLTMVEGRSDIAFQARAISQECEGAAIISMIIPRSGGLSFADYVSASPAVLQAENFKTSSLVRRTATDCNMRHQVLDGGNQLVAAEILLANK
eukprot:GHVU01172704.1.p1 GENE.GHVU01172704.1~~GHVU01172704.1.p1  ORF type:complete len:157 (+),score=9.26 GHVU01172704.1:699-1169(+)